MNCMVSVSVTKLTVSAGESKVLQLPEKSVTLSAFVLPKAEEGRYPIVIVRLT